MITMKIHAGHFTHYKIPFMGWKIQRAL